MTIKTLSLLVLIFSISCKKTESSPKNFVGTWYDTGFKAENKTIIKILDNNTFLYNGGNSNWTGFSNGTWEIIGDTIELSSSKMEECYNVSTFSDCDVSNEKNKITTTIPGCIPEIDVSYVIITKEKFYIKNDSLIYKSKTSSKCLDKLKISFAKTPKTKK